MLIKMLKNGLIVGVEEVRDIDFNQGITDITTIDSADWKKQFQEEK